MLRCFLQNEYENKHVLKLKNFAKNYSRTSVSFILFFIFSLFIQLTPSRYYFSPLNLALRHSPWAITLNREDSLLLILFHFSIYTLFMPRTAHLRNALCSIWMKSLMIRSSIINKVGCVVVFDRKIFLREERIFIFYDCELCIIHRVRIILYIFSLWYYTMS